MKKLKLSLIASTVALAGILTVTALPAQDPHDPDNDPCTGYWFCPAEGGILCMVGRGDMCDVDCIGPPPPPSG